MTNSGGIDPKVIKFIVAVAIVGLLVETVDRFSNGAAWTLVIIILLGLLMNNPLVTGALLNLGGSLEKGLA